MKKAPFVVSLVSDLRPLVELLNRELLEHKAQPVRREEFPEIDTILHEALRVHASWSARCDRCGGYVSIDVTGDRTCLNCGWAAGASRHLQDVIGTIAQDLLEHRGERSSRAAG